MATEKRLIDADAVRHDINVHMAGVIHRGIGFISSGKDSNSAYEFLRGYEEGAKYIANLVLQEKYLMDTVEVVHGHWIEKEYVDEPYGGYYLFHCSECGIPNARERNYCPNCGAKMDGDGNA